MKKTIIVDLVLIGLMGACGFGLIFFNQNKHKISTINTPICQPPCWYGIYPGKSTALDVMTVLAKYDWINQNSVHNQKVGGEKTIQIRWLFMKPISDIAAYLYFHQERVALIKIIISSTLNVEDAFALFGQPEQVVTYLSQGEIAVTLIYPEDGVLLMLDLAIPADPAQNEIEIRDDLFLNCVGYFEPAQLNQLLGTSLYGSIPVKIKPDDARPWQEDRSVKFR